MPSNDLLPLLSLLNCESKNKAINDVPTNNSDEISDMLNNFLLAGLIVGCMLVSFVFLLSSRFFYSLN